MRYCIDTGVFTVLKYVSKNKLGIGKYFGKTHWIMEEIPIINTMQYYARLKKSIRIILKYFIKKL